MHLRIRAKQITAGTQRSDGTFDQDDVLIAIATSFAIVVVSLSFSFA